MGPMGRVVLIGCVLTAVLGGTSGRADEPWRPAFEAGIAERTQSDDIVGLAVGVVQAGQPIFMQTYGSLALGQSASVDPDTVFRIASLSKGFAASLVAQLIVEGRLSLDTPATTFTSDLRLKGSGRLGRVTLNHVLTHRLGLPPYAFDNLLEADVQPPRILRRLGTVDAICGVGTCHAYQNVAFNVVVDAVEEADGRPYAEAMAARLFRPLSMDRASLSRADLQQDTNWARPHRRRRGEAWRLGDVQEAYYRLPAAAGVNASLRNMTAWLAAQMGHRPDVLDEEMLRLLHTPRVSTPAQIRRVREIMTLRSAAYGLGWRVYDYGGETVINHGGSVQGYGAVIGFLPDRDLGIVTLTNSPSKAFWQIFPLWLDSVLTNAEPSSP